MHSSEIHSLKHPLLIDVIDGGITISIKDEHSEKAY